jgi:hypothetical protein
LLQQHKRERGEEDKAWEQKVWEGRRWVGRGRKFGRKSRYMFQRITCISERETRAIASSRHLAAQKEWRIWIVRQLPELLTQRQRTWIVLMIFS